MNRDGFGILVLCYESNKLCDVFMYCSIFYAEDDIFFNRLIGNKFVIYDFNKIESYSICI